MITIKTVIKLLSGPPIRLLVNGTELVKFKDGTIFIGRTTDFNHGMAISYNDPLPYLYDRFGFRELQIQVTL